MWFGHSRSTIFQRSHNTLARQLLLMGQRPWRSDFIRERDSRTRRFYNSRCQFLWGGVLVAWLGFGGFGVVFFFVLFGGRVFCFFVFGVWFGFFPVPGLPLKDFYLWRSNENFWIFLCNYSLMHYWTKGLH